MTKEERDLARQLPGPSQLERVRAARAIIDAHRGPAAERLALRGFMAIFHPNYPEAKLRELLSGLSGR